MMFMFKLKDVVKLMLAIDAKRRKDKEEDPEPPGMYLVHDSGVYLMSSGHPPVSEGKKAKVVYAEGFGPETYLGGDDFAETIPLDSIKRVLAAKPAAVQFQVRLTDTEMEISCI